MTISLPAKTGIIAATGLLAGILLSWPLWNTDVRSMPALPLFEGLSFSPIPGIIPCGILILSLLVQIIFPAKKTGGIFLLACLLVFCLLDINRLQAWVWFYTLILLSVLFSRQNMEQDGINVLRLLIAAVYAWGGFYKISPYFAEDNFPWFCEAFDWLKWAGQVPNLGYLAAVLEILLGVGLLLPKTRPYFRWITIGFHVFILLTLSPLGLNWNTVVVPWNMTMALMVWLLFKENDPIVFPRRPIQLGIVALGLIAPALNLVGAWPDALSWKMYSNTQAEVTFYTDGGAPCPDLQSVWQAKSFNEGQFLLLDDWSQTDMHVPLFTSRRTL